MRFHGNERNFKTDITTVDTFVRLREREETEMKGKSLLSRFQPLKKVSYGVPLF